LSGFWICLRSIPILLAILLGGGPSGSVLARTYLAAVTRATAPEPYRIEPYDYASARALASELGVSPPVAATLVRRGYATPAEARAFLEPTDSHDPFAFEAMDEVVTLLLDAVERGRGITVHGDYDVDGVCATAILVAALRELAAEVDWYLPSRQEEGYGLSATSVERIARRGTAVLVTVDCGIGCPDEVRAARERGMKVIVTDHHEPGRQLPDCPILHPRLGGYPFPELCAAGVAHKLATALRQRRGRGPGLDLDLVALATVADLVPLRGENRALVRAGLSEARRSRRPGLRALMAAAAVDPARLDEGDVAFRLAPRINAAGRLYRADAGVELMLTSDQERAEEIARELDRANRERREAELEALAGAETALAELPGEPADRAALVVAGEGWHPGVVGIVASRLVERYWRPAVVIGLDGDGRGRGSARSIPGYDLLSALRDCGEQLLRYGGHEGAAGLEIEARDIPAFREALEGHARATIAPADLQRIETVDAVVGGESLGLAIAEELEQLAPFGRGNPEIRLLVPGARIRDVRPMGEGKHARFSLESGPRRALGVAFGVNGSLSEAPEGTHDLSIKLEVNEWKGAVEPRVVLRELYPVSEDAGSPVSPPCETPAVGEEWWRRFDAELGASLEEDPAEGSPVDGEPGRESVDRRGCSAVACIADLLSSGRAVLAVCADAARRSALAKRAADPKRFGGGAAAHLCGRCSEAPARAGVDALLAKGRGLAIADWAALGRHPELARPFEHVVMVDPAPLPALEALAARGSGYLHLAWGQAELELAMRVHELDWPRRAALAGFYRELRERCGGTGALTADALGQALAGDGRYPRSAEQAARRCRVLAELGLIAWEGRGVARSLRVVSSEATDLVRSTAFRAYRARFEEGKRFLSRRRAPT
jgi:single-stranded-DNA-specific exonuclease